VPAFRQQPLHGRPAAFIHFLLFTAMVACSVLATEIPDASTTCEASECSAEVDLSLIDSVEDSEGDQEHPLQWLQPTPPRSPELRVAYHVPQAWSMNMLDAIGAALSGTNHHPSVVAKAGVSDGSTTVSEDGITPPSCGWDHLGSEDYFGRDCCSQAKQWMSLSTVPPLPHMANVPEAMSASPTAWQMQMGPAVPTGSFSDLAAWSAVSESVWPCGQEQSWSVEALAPQKAATSSSAPGLSSRGSLQHQTGRCKPCAFVHRAVGCADGSECSFCHLCGPDEKKLRQKHKSELIRQRRLRRMTTHASEKEPAL